VDPHDENEEPNDDPSEKEGSQDGAKASGQGNQVEKLRAKNVWISRCKSQNNFVVYCSFENTETGELELHSIGKNQGGGLLGLGENVQEALSFKKMDFKDPSDKEGKRALKITSIDDVRCGQNHTIMMVNQEHVFVLGCYDRGSQSQEEIMFAPKLLKLCE